MFLHEVGDDIYIARGHVQVHLHCESTAKPVRKTQKDVKYYGLEELVKSWIRGKRHYEKEKHLLRREAEVNVQWGVRESRQVDG